MTPAERMAAIFDGNPVSFVTADFTKLRIDSKTGKRIPKYTTHRRAPTLADFESHLAGKLGLTIVPVKPDGTCKFGKIDIDDYHIDGAALAVKVRASGRPLVIERSKSGGFHLAWYMQLPRKASEVRATLTQWARELGYEGSEIFPKQDVIEKGRAGNGINIPYFGGDGAQNHAIGKDGVRLTLAAWLHVAETAPEWHGGNGAVSPPQDDPAATAVPPGTEPEIVTHNCQIYLFTKAVHWRKAVGFGPSVLLAALRAHNQDVCRPPITDDRVRDIAKRVGVYKTDAQDRAPPPWSAPFDFIHSAAVLPFDATDVPSSIGDYAERWARHAGFDCTGLIAACVVTAASALNDAITLAVQFETAWCESARLWACVFAPPGFAKSPMIRAAVRPLQDMHKASIDLYAMKFAEWQATQPQAGEKGGPISDPPPRPALYTNDCTIEKLSEVLSDNPGGVLYLSEEFDSWLGSHDAYRTGGGSRDRGEWLQLFDGGPHQVDRVKRGSFYVPNWGVSLLSATTPIALQKMARNLPNDGLLQRVLVFMITAAAAPDRGIEVTRACDRYCDVIQKVHTYQPCTLDETASVTLNPDARQLLEEEISYYRELAPACGAISEGLAGHVAKYGTLLARITLTFHAVECAQSSSNVTDIPISIETVKLARKFLRKAFTHARALHRDLGGNDTALNVARRIALGLVADGIKVKVEEREPTVSRRTLMRRYETFSKAPHTVQLDATKLLIDFGWCREMQSSYDKGYPTCWEINPAIYDRFREDGEDWLRQRALVKEAITGGGES